MASPEPRRKKKVAISVEDVKLIVGRAIGGPADVLDYQLRGLCSAGEENQAVASGFSSSHQRLEITIKRQFKPDEDFVTERLDFFAKFPSRAPPTLVDALARLQAREKEVEFFEQIATRLCSYAPRTGAWAPRCYLAKEEAIVLEDLEARGFAILEAGILFDEERLKAAARAQARLHAASYVTESILIKEQGKSLKDLAPIACQERVFDKTSEYLELRKSLLLEWLVRVIDDDDDAARADHRLLLASSLDRVFDWLYFENGKNIVISHGDTWAFNMMFDKSEPPKCRLVDFQLTRYGPRAFDLAQMIYFTTTGETRAKYEASAIEAYHLEFCETLRRNGFEPISTLAELQEHEYEEARLAALFAAATYYPFLLLSKEVHESFESPDDLYTKFIYRSNNDAVFSLMERDENYRSRLTELALELLDHCKKLDAISKTHAGS